MNIPTRALAFLTAALLWLAPAVTVHANKVYRCGPDGRIYSQTPWKDGYEVIAADKRSADQQSPGRLAIVAAPARAALRGLVSNL